ncbi:hypothetical protein DENSPDRAFT_855503 [Dentipellis sp. KUC8613]|nr:hypothetical protein DENSPDRAFT_855503 [Dentipellis sp. KUC8613]
MGRRSWATPQQLEWLETRVDRVQAVRNVKGREKRDFWVTMYNEWFTSFPCAQPTPEDIAAANNKPEKAVAEIQLTWRNRVYQWYSNHQRSPGTSTTKSKYNVVLDLSSNK